ncbi:Ig-like domain-containing protein [Demequina sp. B12]|uniref:Ig-like domain-containing protein n=1 Tax=Demequina sp. B12 TaxID=2992757 RepID=UPI00237B29B5|nr:Ig-like domain-containing protein [Demequina sp. B12]MDE0572064.1 Ig-like domain-containing protein [Demequina sp. B12]
MSAVETGLGRATAARWRVVRRIGVGALVAAILVGVFVAPGFDEREVTPDSPSVWALQTGTGQRFARVNTTVGELDTVKGVAAPSDLVQNGGDLLVFSNNLGSVTQVDAAMPFDISAEAPEATVATPTGTDAVVSTGTYVAYLTDTGQVFAGDMATGSATSPRGFDPFADVEVEEGEERPQFRAATVSVSTSGIVGAYSPERRAVLTGNVVTGEVLATSALPEGPETEGVQITWVGDTWVLYDEDTARLWIQDLAEPLATGAAEDALLQKASSARDEVLIADDYGIVSAAIDGTSASYLVGPTDLSRGTPARPTESPDGAGMVAAWLGPENGPGELWMSGESPVQLSYGEATLGERVVPVLRSNGSRLVLNEARTGWVWDVPSGRLIGSSQQWEIDDEVQQAADDREVATEVTEPRAPIAQDDAFGARAGRQVALPVLLNDHDANGDVLAVDPASLTGLDEAFGTAHVADDSQLVVVDVADNATGTATLTYAITDGTADDGLESEPATVTITIKDESENSPPQWCGVDDCQVDWPSPQVNPGGTVNVDVLTGWVDPEGDPIYLASAHTSSSVGVTAPSPEGQLVFQHTNPSTTETGSVPITVEVADAFGASNDKDLTVAVVGEPELRVEDLAVTVTTGVQATVELAERVTGARGPLTVTEASAGTDSDAVVATAQGLVGFTFSSEEPGSFLVDFTVNDGISDGRGMARITVIDPEDSQLTTAPLTAFVRTHEDVTVDVLAAVTDPGRNVLLLSDLHTTPADGAQLSADIVGHSALRLSGDTETGQPGTLGTVSYTVSDGSGRPESTVRGEITVILLGTDVPATPLAVDDSITVRAGTQADIKVLANDVGPAGNVIALDADSVELADGGGLAFPAGTLVRYLAPQTPGVYTIDYSAYVLGYPTQSDKASVVVTVLANETNQPPTPQPLAGRVAAGQEVRLPFDGTGTDPDGDRVSLKAIETQPSTGAARVSADGRSLVYTADAGFSGQVAFTFSVEDARGATATATATVGVLAAELDPRPVTYTDYVQAQVGEDRRVVITPTANDIDLSGGELQLVSVVPDAKRGTDEYDALAAHVGKPDGDRIQFTVGTEPGTLAFVYTVANSQGSTSIGRIILKAVREPIADVPIITDTVLTADTREQFADGVDVLADKVAWGAGDPAGLTLSLWGSQEDLTVSGRSISGPLPDSARLVPFQVSGVNFAGEEVVSYGFLRVPGDREIIVALKENFTVPEVNENESITFDMADLIALPPETSFTIDADAVAASGSRAQGVCTSAGGTRLTYSAGEGEPYTDTCAVPVLVDGQDEPTTLPVPVIIIPEIPVPTLAGAALEVSPGEEATFDLAGMVSWPDGAPGRPVEFGITEAGEWFTVSRSGTVLTLKAASDAPPGNTENITVTLTSDPETPPVSLALEVGPAPSTLPKGATVTQTCSQADGSSCTIDVIGGSGEVNPLPETQLELVSVSSDGTCSGVSFDIASDTAVRASWTGDTAGAKCSASFVVRDAQKRLSSGERLGSVTVDLQGFPGTPAALTQTAYGDGSITLGVDPGAAASAYPAITGFSVTAGGTEVATCTASGACSQITGLSNGEKTQYSVVAVNSVGKSKGSASATAWAYAPPAQPALVSTAPSVTGGEGLRADLVLRVSDPSTRSLQLTSASGEQRTVQVSGRGNVTVNGYLVGSNTPQTVTVTPVTRHELPPVGASSESGETLSFQANGVGGPLVTSPSWKASTDGQQVTFTAQVASAGTGSETYIGIAADGQHCTPNTRANGGSASVTVTVESNRLYTYNLCAESRVGSKGYGTSSQAITGVYTYQDPGAPAVNNGYGVSNRCEPSNSARCETSWSAPSVQSAPRGFELRYSHEGAPPQSSFSLANAYGNVPSIRAVYCPTFLGTDAPCSDSSTAVGPADTTRSYPTEVTFVSCSVANESVNVTVAAQPGDYTTAVTWWEDSWSNTQGVELWNRNYASIEVTFTGALSGIRSWESSRKSCGDLVDEPAPVVTPTPSPTPTVAP